MQARRAGIAAGAQMFRLVWRAAAAHTASQTAPAGRLRASTQQAGPAHKSRPAHRMAVALLCSSGTLAKSERLTGMVLLSGHLSSDTAMSVALALTPPRPSACVSSASAEDGEALHSCWAAALTASSGGGCCAAGAAAAGREGRQECL